MPNIEISLLGRQQALANGRPLDTLRSGRTLELLAYLAVHRGSPQTRQHVAGVLWPDSTDTQARTNLRRELHQLRDALPDADRFLTIDARQLGWAEDAPCSLDVADFEAALAEANAAVERDDEVAFRGAAERAVHAYRGDLLPGFYDDWVLVERERLRRSCVALLDRLTAVLPEEGAIAPASDLARRRVELEPLEEAGYRRLMELQGRAGDRAAALATYHRCTSVLQRELGVEPCAETVASYQRLFAEAVEPLAPARELMRDAPLLGREAELRALQAAWAGVIDGPRFVVIVGEAGMGKTRLAAELGDAVRRAGGVETHAQCYAARGHVPLAPVAEWLRGRGLRPWLDRLEPVWRRELVRLLPELGTGVDAVPAEPLADAWQRRRFFEGLVRAVLAAEKETLLVLDDLQWCDSETLSWLHLLLRLEPSARLLLVATLRAEEQADNPDLAAFYRRLRAEGILSEVELAPLGVDDTARIAAALGDRPLDADAAKRLRADTGGVPLFVVETARQGSGRSPRVAAVLEDRLAQLSAIAAEIAGVAAAVGRDFSLELIQAATDVGDDVLVRAVDELWRRRLLREHSGTTYDFSHDLLRDAAYQRLSPPHRDLLHRRLADALEHLHADNLPAAAAQIAVQRERGGQPQLAIRYYTLAAEAATAVFALEDAVARYDRALELLADSDPSVERDRRELDIRQAMIGPLNALRGYSSSDLGDCLERTVALSDRLQETRIVITSRTALWAHRFVRGRIDDSMALAQDLTGRVEGHPDLMPQVHLVNAGSLASLGRPVEALAHFRRADVRSGSSTGDETFLLGFPFRVMAGAWRAHPLWLLGHAEEAAASANDALALADQLAHPYGEAVAQAYGAITQYLLGDTERTAELAASVRSLCDRYGFAYYGDWGRVLEGWVTGGAGGEALVRHGMDSLRAQHAEARVPLYMGILADVLARSGRTGEASRVVGEARSLAEAHGDRWWLPELWRLDATSRAGHEGEAMLERALTIAQEHGSRALELRAATDLARRWVDADRPDAATALLRPMRARANGCNPSDVTAADDVLAEAAGSRAG